MLYNLEVIIQMDFRVPLYLDLIIVKVHLEEGVVLITMEVLL